VAISSPARAVGWWVVEQQQAQAEARHQQGPLQLEVMAGEPGIGLNLDHLRPAGAADPGALDTQAAAELGHERQGAEAPPDLVAGDGDQQQGPGHERAPEQAHPRGGIDAGQDQRSDHHQPGGQEQPAPAAHVALLVEAWPDHHPRLLTPRMPSVLVGLKPLRRKDHGP